MFALVVLNWKEQEVLGIDKSLATEHRLMSFHEFQAIHKLGLTSSPSIQEFLRI